MCSWWRTVALGSTTSLIRDLNLNRIPLFAKVGSFTACRSFESLQTRCPCTTFPPCLVQRTQELPDYDKQRAAFIAWLLRRCGGIK